MLVLGVSVFIVLILFCIAASIESAHLIEHKESLLKPNPLISEYENKWSKKNLTTEQRHVLSTHYAKANYTDLGVLVQYQNKNGTNVTYSPTQDEINYRESSLVGWTKTKLRLRIDRDLYLQADFVWIFLLISEIILGVSFPTAKKT